jgi:hypothetical protein
MPASAANSGIPFHKLFSYYRFDNSFLDQRTANNASGTNVAFQTSPKRAGTHSAKFDSGTGNPTATPSYGNIPYSSDFDFGNGTTNRAFSISFWIYPTAENTLTFFITKRGLPTNSEFIVVYNPSIGFQFILFDEFQREASGNVSFLRAINSAFYNLNTWQMVTATYDGVSDIDIYVNEAPTTSTENSNSFSRIKTYESDVIIGVDGSDKNDANRSFNGNKDCLSFFNAKLTPDQIGLMYQKGLNNLELI